MVAFDYSSLDIDTWYEGGPNNCPCFSSEQYIFIYNLPLHASYIRVIDIFYLHSSSWDILSIGPLLTFSEKEMICSLKKAVLEKIRTFFDALPKSDACWDGKQEQEDFFVYGLNN